MLFVSQICSKSLEAWIYFSVAARVFEFDSSGNSSRP